MSTDRELTEDLSGTLNGTKAAVASEPEESEKADCLS